MPDPTPALTVKAMHKRFGSLEVLKGISVTAQDGDVTVHSGSTFRRLLPRSYSCERNP